MNAKEENCILVEVETYAQELVVHYEREAENYFLMTLEYFSVQRQPKQMSFILNFGESYRESRCFIDTKFKWAQLWHNNSKGVDFALLSNSRESCGII